jgi:transcriptional regulator with XRE-family HTH domain
MFGDYIKNTRILKGLSLREFCKRIDMDASNWSKIERGVLSPPQDDEKLKLIAKVLEIKKTSEEWKEMKDKASIGAGLIPGDILSDKKVSKSLPLFFRTLRSEKPTPDELDKLIQIIRKEQ